MKTLRIIFGQDDEGLGSMIVQNKICKEAVPWKRGSSNSATIPVGHRPAITILRYRPMKIGTTILSVSQDKACSGVCHRSRFKALFLRRDAASILMKASREMVAVEALRLADLGIESDPMHSDYRKKGGLNQAALYDRGDGM